jgi:hypothetical protein
MKGIVEVDFERAIQDKGFNMKTVAVNELYQIINEESPSLKITAEETRSLVKYVRDKSGVVSQKVDTCDVGDLMNILMDVSIDLLGNKHQLNETGPSNRYSEGG